MTAQRVTTQQNHVYQQHQRAYTESEAVRKLRRFVDIVGQQHQEDKRQVHKIAMHVLHDQREVTFAEVFLSRLTDSAVGRIGPERFVVSAAIVVASQTESAR